jgi:histidinol-phosphate/aromatic aminotransferase/cobyric acid decarboxylase-like protein
VRSQRAYTLVSPPAARKLNQNESPYDFPSELKREVFDQVAALEWQRYPEFVPSELLERLAGQYRWIPDGILVGNGSNELIQATLSVTLGRATGSSRRPPPSRCTGS